ncbi:MAG TPA: response regulator [Usitatibacter sp.]|nr:response regulator [Usitatibacter sp.]
MGADPAARILVVDDEEAQMRALCDTLRDSGYEAVGHLDGPTALAVLPAERFDLLMSDLMMPGMDGITLLRRAQEADPNLMGVIMTGEGTIPTAVEAMKAGAFDYILKPFRLSAILPVLSRALAVRSLRLEKAALEEGLRTRTAELEAANRELESFAYSVSHDLRAPLHAVTGFASLLENGYAAALDDEGRRLLGVVVRNTRKMDRLIDDLLAFSRLGRELPAMGEIDMGRLVEEALGEIPRDPARPVQIDIGALPPAHGDARLMRQVWVNLLSNALKFAGKRERPVVEVSGARVGNENVYRVRDNGAGFDMKHYDRLFRVFQRLHSEQEFPGTGAGLAIVHRVVAKHGGRVWAESRVDEGAVFYVSLPRRADA